jgi:nucleotide-binding universal stress UspA family protein
MDAEIATSSTGAGKPEPEIEVAFRRIVCGVDGSRSSFEATRQAATLASPGTILELVAVAHEWGAGLNASATLTRSRARRALDQAARELRGSPARIETRLVSGHPPYEALTRESEGADLLVVARHSKSRLGGMAIGRTTTNLVHRSGVPLLIAVAPPQGRSFPGRILVAADGPGNPEQAVRLAGLIARGSGSDITLLRLAWSRHGQRPEMASAVAHLTELGVEPVEILMGGIPRRQISAVARSERASLVVVGSRGLTGLRAVDSTSERVAHEAPCSVLVVRPSR